MIGGTVERWNSKTVERLSKKTVRNVETVKRLSS